LRSTALRNTAIYDWIDMSIRQSLAPVHGWAGLLVGWILFFVFITGSVGYFENEIDRWMMPELPISDKAISNSALLELGAKVCTEHTPMASQCYVELPGNRRPFLTAWLWEPPTETSERGHYVASVVDTKTGDLVQTRETGGGRLLYRMHYNLHYMLPSIAYVIVGLCSIVLAFAIVTGVIVHRRIFRDFFTIEKGRGQRSWLNMHNAFSILALPFHVMITYSGLVIMMTVYWSVVLSITYGPNGTETYRKEADHHSRPTERSGIAASLTALKPLLAEVESRWGEDTVFYVEITNVGDSTASVTFVRSEKPITHDEAPKLIFNGVTGQFLASEEDTPSTPQSIYNVLYNLHEGQFADSPLRWLYFLSGLLGAGMIATGLILWSVKRRVRHLRKYGKVPWGVALAERLNLGTIIGLPIGIAGYFWANRLLPVGIDGRVEWEVHVMFIVWAVLFAFSALRSLPRAWVELLWMAAAAYGLIPLVNMMTTNRHLGISLLQNEWGLAGFDMTMLALGIGFALVAIRARRKQDTVRLVSAAANA
jgi:uncharacterized iron-regulated membrane protein